MTIVYAVLWLAGFYPLACAWRANRSTSLLHAVAWAIIAWCAWGWALLAADADHRGVEPGRYVALCLTGGAGVAVLGARRPHVFAWNFVVLGLLAVMQLPLVESLVIGTDPTDALRIFFLAATLAVGICNYLPTRSAPAVVLLGATIAMELVLLFGPDTWAHRSDAVLLHLLLLLTPWAAWVRWRAEGNGRSEFDREWLDFRDRMGLLWAQRVREQFNNAAEHAGWNVRLAWRGLHRTTELAILPSEQDAMLETLRAALKRFAAAR